MRHLTCLGLAVLLAACSSEQSDDAPPEPTQPDPAPAQETDDSPNPARADAKPVERDWPAAREATPEGGDRIHSKVRFLWIRPKPSDAVEWIGYLSMGDSVRVKGGDAAAADAGPGSSRGCARWYAIEPRGYVCAGEDATLDGDDADVVELRKGRAKRAPFPYAYGESLGTTVYLNIPPKRRQYFRESAFHEHMESVARAREAKTDDELAAVAPALLGVDLKPTGNDPPKLLLHLGPRSRPQKAAGKYGFPEVVRGSTIAYAYSFDAAERTWVMSWDRGIIPKDRVRVFPQSQFHGVPLGDGVALPLAFMRQVQPKLRRSAGGGVEPSGDSWPRYASVGLTGEELEVDGERYLVTNEAGLLCNAGQVSAPRLRQQPPKGVREGRANRWIDVSITGGWLVAYEQQRPVYTTLISPGRGGLPVEGKTLLETASTPVGDFAISGKFHTATMTSNYSEKVVHSEVPYTQNFSGPYALHTAYWHDDWGVGKSGGCVNLSPIDGMRLFAWTDPQLPPGWHGMRGQQADSKAYASATIVSVHR